MIQDAVSHLRASDKVMRCMIEDVGPCLLRPQRDRFAMLVRSIISQQISTGAARSIRKRLEVLANADHANGAKREAGITASRLLQLSTEQLRTAGVSAQKASYLLDLAAHVDDGRVKLNQIGRYRDEQVIEQLTAVKGIGEWTAQMFLIFSLGRPDVFPHGDLGVRSAIRNRYGLDDLPDKATSFAIAEKWRPFASVASWYCWRSLDVS